MSLKYYDKENKKHAKIKAMKLTKRQAKRLTHKLLVAFDLDTVPVTFNRWGSGDFKRSWFLPKTQWQEAAIAYGEGMMNLLTVAHEVAHYIRWVEHQKSGGKFRWHDHLHAKVVDKCIALLTTGA